jgi:hypothetical protein
MFAGWSQFTSAVYAVYESYQYYRTSVEPTLEVSWSRDSHAAFIPQLACVKVLNSIPHLLLVQDGSKVKADVYVWRDEYRYVTGCV